MTEQHEQDDMYKFDVKNIFNGGVKRKKLDSLYNAGPGPDSSLQIARKHHNHPRSYLNMMTLTILVSSMSRPIDAETIAHKLRQRKPTVQTFNKKSLRCNFRNREALRNTHFACIHIQSARFWFILSF